MNEGGLRPVALRASREKSYLPFLCIQQGCFSCPVQRFFHSFVFNSVAVAAPCSVVSPATLRRAGAVGGCGIRLLLIFGFVDEVI